MASLSSRLLTYDEWLRMPPIEDNSAEIAEEVRTALLSSLQQQLGEDLAATLGSNVDLMTSRQPLTRRSPDIAVYRLWGMSIQDAILRSAPGLIVEILSSAENRRRKEEKLADYASVGVPEVWLVSPEAETVEVLLLKEGKLERSAILAEGSLQPTQFAGVAVSVSAIFPGESVTSL